MKQIIENIEQCGNCKFIKRYYTDDSEKDFIYECWHPEILKEMGLPSDLKFEDDEDTDSRKIDNINQIPNWCPLPDAKEMDGE